MNFFKYLLFCIICVQIKLSQANNQFLPLTFSEAINKLNRIITSQKDKTSISPLFNRNNNQLLFDDQDDPNSLIKNALFDLNDIHFPNVTNLCKDQFLNFTSALYKKELWAIAGLYIQIIFKIIISWSILNILYNI